MKLLAIFFSFVLSYSSTDAHDVFQRAESTYYDWANNYKKQSPYKNKESRPNNTQRWSKQVNDVLEDLLSNFQRIQKSCYLRNSCLKDEKNLLVRKGHTLGQRHVAYKAVYTLFNMMESYSKRDLFVTSLYLYKNMTKEGRSNYSSGLRVQSLTKDGKYTNYAKSSPFYVLDDILNIAIQKIERNRSECQERKECLMADKEILSNLAQQLDSRDPTYKSLKKIMKNLETEADKQVYDGASLIKMYQTKGEKEALKAKFISKDEQEWKNIDKANVKKVIRKARTVGVTQKPRQVYPSYQEERQPSYYQQPRYQEHDGDDPYYYPPSREHYGTPPRYREEPRRVYREESSREYRDEPSRYYREEPSRVYRDAPSRGYREEPSRKSREKENYKEIWEEPARKIGNSLGSYLSNLFGS